MIRKMITGDEAILMEYLEKDPHLHLFFIGDLIADGFDDSIQEYFGYFKDGELKGAFLLYDKLSLHIEVDEAPEMLIDFVLELFQKTPFTGINMGEKTKDLIDGRLDSIISKSVRTSLSVYYPNDQVVDTTGAKRLGSERIGELLEVQDEVFPSSVSAMKDNGLRIKRAIANNEQGKSRYYGVIEEGSVRSVATATALTPNSAMIVAVGTKEADRTKGYATALVKMLSDDLYKDGMHGVLFYDNPDAARIYERLGYTFYTNYYMISVKRDN